MNKAKKNLKSIINFTKKTPKLNFVNIILSILIITIIILQIRKPFLTNSLSDLKSRLTSFFKMQNNIKEAYNDIKDIEEESLIRINMNQGGVDDINATNNNKIMRPSFMLQSSIMGEKALKETFANLDNTLITLKLFYTPNCPYSQQFMPLWTQIKESLPTYIKTEEINCQRKDVLGFSLCKSNNIKKVPSIILVKPDTLKSDETIDIKYHGSMDYLSIKQWLNSQNIPIEYNPEVEHFDRTGGHVSVEKFNELKSGLVDTNLGNMLLSAEGNLRAPFDKMYRDASKMNEHGEFHDVDEDGCPIATFSMCNENSVKPGYQIFTSRGQWGCIYPDKNTSINNGFDAAFSVVDHYLQSLPPKMEQVVSEDGSVSLKVSEYSADEKIEQMKRCANKYNKEIRNFGLCNNDKLNEKYVIKERIERGEARLPSNDISIDDYNDTKETAEAIYSACTL